MTENPSNDVQDPAEPKQVDTAVETSEQPEPVTVEPVEPTVVETPAEDDHQG